MQTLKPNIYIRKRIFILVVLGLVTGFVQAFAGQSAERVQDKAAQPSKNFQVELVWVEEELAQPAGQTAYPGLTMPETVRPLPGNIYVLVEFVLLAKKASTSPVLVDSEGTRYMPVGVSEFSTAKFSFFVPTVKGLSRALQSIKSQQLTTGVKVEVTQDEATGQLTIIKEDPEPGAKFTAVWTVPQDVLLRCSEFKLHFGEVEPLVIDTLELRKK